MKYSRWKLVCKEYSIVIYSEDILPRHITDSGMIRLIKALLTKYALNVEDIVNLHCRSTSRRYNNLIAVIGKRGLDGKIISYSAEAGRYKVYAYLA